jgi:hypothetical protein
MDSLMKIRFLLLLCYCSCNILFSQNDKQLSGQVKIVDATPNHILVLNLNTGQETFTDKRGLFSIPVHLGDVLVFYSDHLDKMRKLIDEDAYNSTLVEVAMTSIVQQLDEVIINTYSHINAYDLGITKTRIETLSPAERDVYSNEPRAKEFSEKLKIIDKIKRICDTTFFKNLSIEELNLKGFLYFAVDHEWFIGIAKKDNTFLTRFYLMSLSLEFNKLQNKE